MCVSTDDDVLQLATGGLLDAPVSGGRPAAVARTLTTLVGGREPVARRCEPVFGTFSAHVLYLGSAGSGQAAKLFNNALLMMNQANIAEIVELAVSYGTDPVKLVEALKLGSATSAALSHLNGAMVNLETVDHLVPVGELDMQIFQTAMAAGGVHADAATARGLTGIRGLHGLLRRLSP